MKVAATFCNIVLLGFTCLITLTDGAPTEAGYIALGLLLVMTPILNVVLISRGGTSSSWLSRQVKGEASEKQRKIDDNSSISTTMKIITIICNIVLLGFASWAFIDQYPHPEEAGLLEFELLVILTPILSAVVIFRNGSGKGWLSRHIEGKALEEQREIDDPEERQDS